MKTLPNNSAVGRIAYASNGDDVIFLKTRNAEPCKFTGFDLFTMWGKTTRKNLVMGAVEGKYTFTAYFTAPNGNLCNHSVTLIDDADVEGIDDAGKISA